MSAGGGPNSNVPTSSLTELSSASASSTLPSLTSTSSTPTITTITAASDIASYNRGPITSIYVPPSSCLSTLTLQNTYMVLGHYLSGDPACYPKGTMDPNELLQFSTWLQWYYSPAVCPSGWTVAETMTSLMAGYSPYVLPDITIGEFTTARLCCPSQFSYMGYDHACTALLSSGRTIEYVSPSEYSSGMSYSDGDFHTTVLASDLPVYADGVPIWWEASDSEIPSLFVQLTQTSSSHSSTATSSSVTATSTTSSTASATTTGTNGGGSSGLSTGAKVAIGVVIPVVVIAAAIGAFLFFRRRKQRDNVPTEQVIVPTKPPGGPTAPAAELAGSQPVYQNYPPYQQQYPQMQHNAPPAPMPTYAQTNNYGMAATVTNFSDYNELEAPFHGHAGAKPASMRQADYTLVPSNDPEHQSSQTSPSMTLPVVSSNGSPSMNDAVVNAAHNVSPHSQRAELPSPPAAVPELSGETSPRA